MSGVNKAIIIGNLGHSPKTTNDKKGSAITHISVATSESWKDKQTGEKQERTEWHRVSMFGRLAEIAAEYLKKGSKVYIEGKLRTRKWQDKDGKDRFTTEIIADQLQMLGEKIVENSKDRFDSNYEQPQQAQTQESTPPVANANAQYIQPKGKDYFGDDIPF